MKIKDQTPVIVQSDQITNTLYIDQYRWRIRLYVLYTLIPNIAYEQSGSWSDCNFCAVWSQTPCILSSVDQWLVSNFCTVWSNTTLHNVDQGWECIFCSVWPQCESNDVDMISLSTMQSDHKHCTLYSVDKRTNSFTVQSDNRYCNQNKIRLFSVFESVRLKKLDLLTHNATFWHTKDI